MFKKIVIFFSLFAFIEQINVLVFAQTKKNVAKKSSGSSAKRAASSSKKNASTARASSRRGLGVATRALSRSSSTSSYGSSSTTTENCVSKFTECMDAQIDGIISNYQYLSDDAAIQAMQETGEPFRCIYYNSSKVEGLFANDERYCSSDLIAKRKETYLDSTGVAKKKDDKIFNNMNICSNQKDVNELYLSYNYYCDLSTSDVGVAGIPVNKCNLKATDGKSKSGVFATKDSYAYYNEANRRISNGELKIINFEKTNLFKNKIEPLGLENWNQMSLTGKTCTYAKGDANEGKACTEGTDNCNCTKYENSVNDLLEDLGLTSSENELFSINVVPPVGVGSFDIAAQYDKARNICLGNTAFNLVGKKATENEKVVQSAISYLSSNCSDTNTRRELERYYIAGTVVKSCADGYTYNAASNICSNPDDPLDTMTPYSVDDYQAGNAELEQTDFLSAKKSCDLYEQTLISTRNKAYADFDTQLKNYIDDEVAKLIKNKSKSLTTIANALNSVQQVDAQITIDNMERQVDVKNSLADAEISMVNAELNLESKKIDVDKKILEVHKERVKSYSKSYLTKISSYCSSKGYNGAEVCDKKDYTKCSNMVSFYINRDGDVKDPYANEYGKVVKEKQKMPNGYEEMYCREFLGGG